MGKTRRRYRQLKTLSTVVAEVMEARLLYSGSTTSPQASTYVPDNLVILQSHMATPFGYSSPSGAPITPALMRDAYGLGTFNASSITFNGSQGTGAGQTIALVEGGSDPDIAADLTAFDAYWNLPAAPSLLELNSTGGTTLPAVNGDQGELDLDVEWAHVMAPLASLIVYCGSLYTDMTTAAATAGVSVISTSYGISGTEGIGEFETPTGHSGVTFLASTGDTGGTVVDPAKSPAVVAVGGTDLTMSGTTYGSETGWDAGGGGINTAESQPTYQQGNVSEFSTTQRTTPDVALDADPGTGVAVYDELDDGTTDPWVAIVGGTSLSCPLMAAIVAVADQGRVAAGLTSMDGYTQTLPRLYQLYAANYSANYHDITTGNNTHAAGVGYDLSTGIGSPKANNLIYDLAGADTISGQAYIDVNGNGVYDSGTDTPLANQKVYLDLVGNGVEAPNDPVATTDANGNYIFSDVIGSWTGEVRLANSTGYLSENNTTLTTAYNTSQTYNLIFASSTTYTATASPTTVTAFNTSLGVTISGTAPSNLIYTWTATTSPYGSSPVFTVNGTNASQNTTVTFNDAGTYVFTAQIANGSSGQIATTSVTVTVNQTLTSAVVTPVTPNITGGTTQQMTATGLDQFGDAMLTQPTFTWSVTAGTGSINSAGLYTAATSGTLATVKAVYSTFSATQQIYVVSSPWVSADIGAPTVVGTAFDSSAVFNLSSASTGITGTSDQFHYVYRALGGDGTIIARVATQSNSNASAGAGVMIRDSLAVNSQEVLMGVTPTSGAIFETRTTTGGTTTASSVTGITAPYWVKLVRSGNKITGYDSVNGTTWVLVSSTSVPMTGSIYVGLFDTGHSSTAASVATIDNITLMVAANDSANVSAGVPVAISVLTNDVGPAGDTLTITSASKATDGSVVINSNGTITYSTSNTIAGSDSFTYTISDGVGDTATATVSINILGLEAYYKMNEGAGTTTADATGNNNTGTLTDTAWTTGVAGDGLAFNGSNSEVSLPALNISTATVTFSGWFYSSGTQSSDAGLIFERNGSIANGLDMYNGTTVGYSWGTSAGTYDYAQGPTLPTAGWTFLALVITATTATIYEQPLGGTLKYVTNTLANPVETFTTPIVLGQDTSSSTRYYSGSMDEVRIYDTSLSLAAVTALGLKGSFLTAAPDTVTAYAGAPGSVNVLTNDSGPNGSTLSVTGFTQPTSGTVVNEGNGVFNYSTTSLISGTDSFTYTLSDGLGDTTTGTVTATILGIIAEYKFDEGSGLVAVDSTGDNFTGTNNNTNYSTGLTGLSTDHSLVFNSSSDSDVTFATSPSLSGTGNFSVGAWIKTTSTAGGVIIQQRDVNGFEGEYQLAIGSSGTVSFYLYNNGYQFDITTTTKVNTGSWVQVTGIRNGSNGYVYINGVQAGTGSGTALSLTSTITVAIGSDIRGTDDYFNGSMDNVFIANDALSLSGIASVSTLGPIVSTPATASPSPVTAMTTTLSVAGSDFYESVYPLTYSWATTTLPTGATAPTFSINTNTSANTTTATFFKAGTYVFTVTMSDQTGLKNTSSVSVVVNQTATTITLPAVNASVPSGNTTQATAYDQFGNPLLSAPVWSVNGGGSISSTGVFTAGTVGGLYTITATLGASAYTTVTVVPTAYSGSTGNDTYAIRLSPSNSSIAQIFVDIAETNSPTYQVSIGQLSSLSFTPASDGSVTVDFTNGNPLPTNGISYSGGNSLIIKGTTTGSMAFSINATQITDTAASASPISYTNLQSVEFDLSGGSNVLTQQAQPAAGLIFNAGAGSNTLTVNGGSFTFKTDPGISSGNLTVNDNSSVVFNPPANGYTRLNLYALNLSGTATASMTASTSTTARTVLETNQLAIAVGGTLDMGNNAMIVHGGNLSTITSLVQSGFNDGNWNGAGIISSSALADTTMLTTIGAISNNNSGGVYQSTFDGISVTANDILLKDTYYGDSNLDGIVDGSDYSRIDNAALSGATGWFNGDFNYDNTIDGSDYTLIDNAYNTQGAALAASIARPAMSTVTVVSESVVSKSSPTGKSRFAGSIVKPKPVFTATTPIASALFNNSVNDILDGKKKLSAKSIFAQLEAVTS